MTEVTTDVRLFGGLTPYSGRLEVKYNDQWGTVCDDGFNDASAKVVCRMMGFSDARHARFIPPSEYGPGTGTIWLDDIKCFGNETDIADCQTAEWGISNCNHDEDIAVDCQTPTRLFGGNAHKGRVEVQIDGEWNSLCKDTFRTAEAEVVCSMLGFSARKAKAHFGAYYGEGQGDIVVDELRCSGIEEDISECKSKDWLSQTNCNHNEDAAVECCKSFYIEIGDK
ncbi:NETR-like protein [Mya arenaria]|uniref:NETR-like protein n=1 Tax=Mya arenaria TaxID=6604 RepID=A0ABY7DDH8_MYAAR|nr:NETR-like protein [Mya arenaria]